MKDHAGHTPGMPAKPNAEKLKQSTPAKPDAGKRSTPAKADPHAGHDMGKSGTPQKTPEKK